MEKIRLEGQDLHQLYEQLMDKKMFLAEQTICQHPEMDKLCSRSVNTVRIVTILSDRGNANVVYALVRIGSGQNDVDNISSGGMYTLLSPEGTITMPVFCDKTVSYYTSHPMTGFAFEGFTVPYFQEALELCRQAAQVEPRLRYIGWDVAITPDGPVLVEGNNLPGYDMCQNYRFHADGCGMKQVEPRLRYIGWDVAITPDGPVLVEGNNLPGYDMCQNYRFHADGCGMKQAFVDAEAN